MKRRRHLSSEERSLWDGVAEKAVPLKPARFVASEKPSRSLEAKPQTHPIQNFRLGEKSQPVSSSIITAGSAPAPLQMDANAFSKMKRGKIAPEGRIDLHGMTVSQAHPALITFIMDAQADAKRLVLVITGKGNRQEPSGPFQVQRGILRRQVPIWLSTAPLRGLVLQTAFAHQRHGGEGALYVYLRRTR